MCRNFPHSQIPPKCLFTLLTSLDKPSPDSLEVLDLVRAEKPLKPTVRIQTYLSDTAFHLDKVSRVLWKHFPMLDIKCENVSSLKFRKNMWCCLAKFVTRCVVPPTKVSFLFQDSCYESSTDPPGVSQIDTAVRLCVTVVNFAPESKRAVQMVVCVHCCYPLDRFSRNVLNWNSQ